MPTNTVGMARQPLLLYTHGFRRGGLAPPVHPEPAKGPASTRGLAYALTHIPIRPLNFARRQPLSTHKCFSRAPKLAIVLGLFGGLQAMHAGTENNGRRGARALALAANTSPISNRNTKLLESPVTYTKHTLAPFSNRNKMQYVFPRHFSSSIRPHSCQEAEHSTDRTEQPASSISPLVSNLRLPASGTSNRYNKLLEIRVSHTKHTTASLSNRYKIAFLQTAAALPFSDWRSTK